MIPKLEVDGVSHSYHSLDGEALALDHVSSNVSPGEFLTVVGPSGCSESTLLSILYELTQSGRGTISIDDIPLTKSPSTTGYTLQEDHLLEWRNIFSNMSPGLEIRRRLDEPTRQELLEIMAACGLAGFEYAKPSGLSGSIRQGATLIRTPALRPDLLLLDEPFSILDCQVRLPVCNGTSFIICQTHKTAILVAHDLSEVTNMTDHILILSPRPGRVGEILSIDFPKTCTHSLDHRNCPEFSIYFNMVWRELKTCE